MVNVLEVKDVSKTFRLDWHARNSIFRYLSINGKNDSLKFYCALQNIDFSVQKGEVFGIVGPNGAGKTTLIKIIAGILKPTSGCVYVNGFLSTFIEWGAAFHPDLDVKHNMYLYGAYFGLTRNEINRKFAEIMRFAELENFPDRKLRSYSTGMIERLALALATELRSNLMVIDDVSNIGDLKFEDHYLRFFEEFKERGNSIVITSHNFELLERLCQRGLYLDQGKQVVIGDIRSVIDEYKRFTTPNEISVG